MPPTSELVTECLAVAEPKAAWTLPFLSRGVSGDVRGGSIKLIRQKWFTTLIKIVFIVAYLISNIRHLPPRVQLGQWLAIDR